MMKKILFLLCTGNYSGAENITLNIAKGISLRGYEAIYCSLHGNIEKYIKKDYPQVIYYPLNKINYLEIIKNFRKIKPDLVHAVDFRASILTSFTRVCYITHLHSNPPWLKHKSIYTLLLLRAMNKAIGNICVSDSIMNEFIFSDKLKSNTQTILNVIDKIKILTLANDSLKSFFDIGFFGRLSEEKDPIRFLRITKRICELCPGTKVVIVGDGILQSECRNFINDNNLSNVKLIGFQLNPYKFMKNCKIIIMPSQYEGFGLTAVESMILGKPVLSSDVRGLTVIQGDTENLCKTDEEYIEKAIRLLKDKNFYQNSSKKARNQAKKFTNINDYINKILNIYRYTSK